MVLFTALCNGKIIVHKIKYQPTIKNQRPKNHLTFKIQSHPKHLGNGIRQSSWSLVKTLEFVARDLETCSRQKLTVEENHLETLRTSMGIRNLGQFSTR